MGEIVTAGNVYGYALDQLHWYARELEAERALADRLYEALVQAGPGHGDVKAAYREKRNV